LVLLPNRKGETPLHYAARAGWIDVVQFFLHHVPHTASIATSNRKLPLHLAAKEGHVWVCRVLLSVYPQGASQHDVEGKLPLHICAQYGHMEVAFVLIQVYHDAIRTLDWEGNLPLHDAVQEGRLKMTRYLIDLYPLALCTSNLRNEIPLFPAVRSRSLAVVALVIQAWPAGCRCMLQNVTIYDNLSTGWITWDIFLLLLRGAVKKLKGCSSFETQIPPRSMLRTSSNWRTIIQSYNHPCRHALHHKSLKMVTRKIQQAYQIIAL
jgi:Ankyrin repeats (3 copies)